MASVTVIVREVEASLNRALAAYEAASDAETREFYLIKLQAYIFLYDVGAGMAAIGINKPTGFAQALALKSLVHNLYEYDQQINRELVPRIVRYASIRKKPIDRSTIKAIRDKWRNQLAKLKTWKSVRDSATGHYGRDIAYQVKLLKGLRQEEVLSVATTFFDFNKSIIQLLPHGKRNDA
jgi:hypothetical protein